MKSAFVSYVNNSVDCKSVRILIRVADLKSAVLENVVEIGRLKSKRLPNPQVCGSVQCFCQVG